MSLGTIQNRENDVRIDFNDVGHLFGSAFTVIPKESTSLILNYPTTSFKVIYMAGTEVVEIEDAQVVGFTNPATDLPFVDSTEMAELLDIYLKDRTGLV